MGSPLADLDHGGTGRCLCGAVRYAFDVRPIWQAHCHCESCRRNCSAPFTSYFAVTNGHWRWTGTTPAARASSPGVLRHFCATCGTPMAYTSADYAHEIHFYAASLDDPSVYAPTIHVHWDERLPWVMIADGLPVRRNARRMSTDADPAPVLALIRAAFTAMEGRIDPPSSVHRLSEAAIREQARIGEVWTLDEPTRPVACMFLTAKGDRLYIGKLAVASDFRGQGLARQLVTHAEKRARALGLGALELETRVELAENHAAFAAMGFTRTGANAHPGFDRPTSYVFTRQVENR